MQPHMQLTAAEQFIACVWISAGLQAANLLQPATTSNKGPGWAATPSVSTASHTCSLTFCMRLRQLQPRVAGLSPQCRSYALCRCMQHAAMTPHMWGVCTSCCQPANMHAIQLVIIITSLLSLCQNASHAQLMVTDKHALCKQASVQ